MVGGSIIDDKSALPNKNTLMKKKTNPDIGQMTDKSNADASKLFFIEPF